MMADPLDADLLRTFLVVAGERGFSRAARRLARTQSAVSQAVARLERDLGERLFVRDGRVTHLTAAGRILEEHARRVLEEMERARAHLAAQHELREGRLVVGTSDTLAYYFLPPVFAAFRARYPGVELRIDNRPSPATAQRVVERVVDVGVVTLPLPAGLTAGGRPLAGRLATEDLASQRDVVICPPGHSLASRRRLRLEALATEPLVLLDRTTASRAFLDAELARTGASPRVVMEMSSVEVVKRLVELGFGLSVVPQMAVEREVAAGHLVALRLETVAPPRRVGLCTASAEPLAPAATAFVAMARGALAARRRAASPRGRPPVAVL
jgi:DNA-binding transcriptional LysR family regulator